MDEIELNALARRIQEKWSEIFSRVFPVHFKPGQVIFYQGHQPTGMYLLGSGKIHLHSKNPPYDQTLVVTADNHPVLGMDFLLGELNYPFSAHVIDEVTAVFLTKTDFMEFFCRRA